MIILLSLFKKMKIKRYKEDKIDENSKGALNDYNKKNILTNIFYHKIFLIMCIFLNLGLFLFICIYHNKIKEIEYLTKNYSQQSDEKNSFYDEQIVNIDSKLTNLIAFSEKRNLFFSYSFINKTEFDMVKKIIIDFHESNWVNKVKNYKIKMIYQSASDYFSYVDLINLLNYNKNLLFIVNSLEDDKFGIFLDEPIIFNKENKFISEANKLILISFKHKIKIKYIGDNPALKVEDKTEDILTVGKGEIVINNYFYNFGGYIKPELDSFEKTNINDNNSFDIIGKFDIKNIEIFVVSFD